MEEASTLSEKTDDPHVRLYGGITAVRIHAAAGRTTEAVNHLKSMIASAGKTGYLGFQFDARLALAEIEMKYGKRAEGRAQLETLEKDARAKGYGLVARKAAAARS